MRRLTDDKSDRPEKVKGWPDRRRRPKVPPVEVKEAVPSDHVAGAAMEFLQSVGPSDEDRRRFVVEKPIALGIPVCLSILQMTLEGNYLDVSCRASGVNVSTFNWWKRKWKSGDKEAEKLDWFFRAMPRAQAFAEVLTLRELNSGIPGNWQKRAWLLERRWGDRWRMKSDKDDAAPEILNPPKPLQDMTPSELESYQAELELHAKKGKPKLGG